MKAVVRWAALGALVLTVSCGPSVLLSDLENQADQWSRPVAAPTITGGSGPFRNPVDVPAVQIAAQETGGAVFFTLDGSYPSFTAGGSTRSPATQRFDGPSLAWPAGGLITSYGITTLRAVAWQPGGRRSAEMSRKFRVLGAGGLVWSAAALGGDQGQTRAVAVAGDGTVYAVGTTVQGGVTVGFILHLSTAGTPLQKVLLDRASQINGVAVDSSGQVLVAGSLDVAANHTLAGTSRSTTKARQGFYAALPADLSGCNYFRVLGLESRFRALALFGTTALVAGGVYESNTVSMDSLNLTTSRPDSNGVAFGFTASTGSALPGSLVGSAGTMVKDEFTALTVLGTSAVVAGWLDSSALSITYGSKNATGSTTGTVPVAVGFQPSSWTVDLAWPAAASSWTGGSEARAVVFDGFGKPLIGGVAVGPATVEGFEGSSAGKNAFLVSIDGSGNVQYVSGPLPGSGSAESELSGLTRSADGQVFGVGAVGPAKLTWGTLDFGGSAPRSPFLIRITTAFVDQTQPTERWTAQDGGAQTGFLTVTTTGTTGSGHVYSGGEAAGSSTLDWGNESRFTYPGSGTQPVVSQFFF